MEAVIGCPRCSRKLRMPNPSAAQVVRCPVCEATFEGAGATESPVGIAAQRRVACSAPVLRKAGPQPSKPWFMDAERIRRGLAWVILALAIDLLLLTIDMVVFWFGVMDAYTPGMDPRSEDVYDLWLDWGSTAICLRILIVLLSAICMGASVWLVLSPSTKKARENVEAALYCLMGAYIPLRALCVLAREPLHVGWLVWNEWYLWADLLLRWPVEGLLMFFAFSLARSLRHVPSLVRLRWLLVLLVVEVALQLTLFTGLFKYCHALLTSRFLLDAMWAAVLLCVPLLLIRLVVAAQLFRVLLAVMTALTNHPRSCEPDTNYH